MGARILLYDRTCVGKAGVGLTTAWKAGAAIYRGAGSIDAAMGVASWDDAARFVGSALPGEDVEEVQYWGHGRFGRILVDRESVDAEAIGKSSFVGALRERIVRGPRALFWMRTCEAFGGEAGHDFARRLADFLEFDVAGHTYVIGFWQSGLHGLAPGATPTWDVGEGIARGTPRAPELGAWSNPLAPRTIHCLEASMPPAWIDRPSRASARV